MSFFSFLSFISSRNKKRAKLLDSKTTQQPTCCLYLHHHLKPAGKCRTRCCVKPLVVSFSFFFSLSLSLFLSCLLLLSLPPRPKRSIQSKKMNKKKKTKKKRNENDGDDDDDNSFASFLSTLLFSFYFCLRARSPLFGRLLYRNLSLLVDLLRRRVHFYSFFFPLFYSLTCQPLSFPSLLASYFSNA